MKKKTFFPNEQNITGDFGRFFAIHIFAKIPRQILFWLNVGRVNFGLISMLDSSKNLLWGPLQVFEKIIWKHQKLKILGPKEHPPQFVTNCGVEIVNFKL